MLRPRCPLDPPAVPLRRSRICLFFFNGTATTEIYTLSLHDALPIFRRPGHLDDATGQEGAWGPADRRHQPHRALRVGLGDDVHPNVRAVSGEPDAANDGVRQF